MLRGEALYYNHSSTICIVPGRRILRGKVTIDTKKALSHLLSTIEVSKPQSPYLYMGQRLFQGRF